MMFPNLYNVPVMEMIKDLLFTLRICMMVIILFWRKWLTTPVRKLSQSKIDKTAIEKLEVAQKASRNEKLPPGPVMPASLKAAIKVGPICSDDERWTLIHDLWNCPSGQSQGSIFLKCSGIVSNLEPSVKGVARPSPGDEVVSIPVPTVE